MTLNTSWPLECLKLCISCWTTSRPKQGDWWRHDSSVWRRQRMFQPRIEVRGRIFSLSVYDAIRTDRTMQVAVRDWRPMSKDYFYWFAWNRKRNNWRIQVMMTSPIATHVILGVINYYMFSCWPIIGDNVKTLVFILKPYFIFSMKKCTCRRFHET